MMQMEFSWSKINSLSWATVKLLHCSKNRAKNITVHWLGFLPVRNLMYPDSRKGWEVDALNAYDGSIFAINWEMVCSRSFPIIVQDVAPPWSRRWAWSAGAARSPSLAAVLAKTRDSWGSEVMVSLDIILGMEVKILYFFILIILVAVPVCFWPLKLESFCQ